MIQSESDIDPELVQRLLLARLLLPLRKPLSRTKLEQTVVKAISPPLSLAAARAAVHSAIDRCERAGYLTQQPSGNAGAGAPTSDSGATPRQTKLGPPRLTDAGARALPGMLSLDALPRVKHWIHAQQLAGLSTFKQRRNFGKRLDADALTALILTERHRLPPSKSPAAAVDRLAWRALGVERDAPFTVGAVQRYLLRDIVPEDARVNPDVWRRMLAMRALGAQGHDAQRLTRALLLQPRAPAEAATARLPRPQPGASQPSQAAPAQPTAPVHNDNAGAPPRARPLPLPDFARAVIEAARRPEVARFHEDRAFIGSVWEHMRGRSPIGDMSLPDFKNRLIAAHRERLLHITRADLVAAMDPREVERSEARYQDATFHFVALDAGGAR